MSNTSTLPANFDASKFLAHIDENADLRGQRVVFYDGHNMHVLREGPLWCSADLLTVVIKPHIGETTLKSTQAAEARESRFYSELFGGVMSCGAAAIGWVVIGGSSAAAPVTGGTSTFVAALAWGATLASSAQCATSGYRLYNEIANPQENDWLDSQGWYTTTARALDIVSLAGAGAATAVTVRAALVLRRTTGKSMVEVLKGLSRQERKRIAEEVIRLENPGISNSALKTMLRAGVYPKRFTNVQVSKAVQTQLKDALGAALSFSGSAGTGTVKELVVGVTKSFETH